MSACIRVSTIEILSIFFLFFCNIPATTLAVSVNFASFGSYDSSRFINTTGDACISTGGIQITPIEINVSQIDTVGRATYIEPLHLWDKNSGNLADFSTHFSFVIDSRGRTPFADGITFFFAPLSSSIKSTAHSGTMGLNTDNRYANSSAETFFAVEFDTYQNSFDPSSPHVGININSMVSVETIDWQTDIPGGRENEAWIRYNGTSKILSVNFTNFLNNVVTHGSLTREIDFRDYMPEKVLFGFSGATGTYFERNTVTSWDFSANLTIEITSNVPAMDDEFEIGSVAKKFLYAELARGTNNFSEKLKLGFEHGRFGGLYRGFLKETNSYVAVKRVSSGSKYASEVKIISQLRHKNLVQLIGWSHERGELLLAYEFLSNGSLNSHFFKHNSVLAWDVRYKIAQGLASVLLYLHEEWEQCVVHRDLTMSDIMLDSNFNAKLGHFGLVRLVDDKGSQATMLAGTKGYTSPEYVYSRRASKESNVYSFGVILLEIICGRNTPIEPRFLENNLIRLVDWVWKLYGAGKILEAVDHDLGIEKNGEEMERLLVVGLWCAHPEYRHRPTMREAMKVMNFEAQLPLLPATMPPVPIYYPNIDMSTSVYYRISGSTNTLDCGHYSNSLNVTTSSAGSDPSTALLKSA